MNTASQNLSYHLGVLQAKLQHATDYELALTYFLEEFAGDAPFMQQCLDEQAPHLKAVLTHVAAQALGKLAELERFHAMRLAEFQFSHGNAFVAGRVLLFLYFDVVNTGLAALIPGVRGGTEVARFRLPPGLGASPTRN